MKCDKSAFNLNDLRASPETEKINIQTVAMYRANQI